MSEFQDMMKDAFGDMFDDEDNTLYTVLVHRPTDDPTIYEGVVRTEVGSAGELFVCAADGCVYVYAAGQWTRVDAVPVDEDGIAQN